MEQALLAIGAGALTTLSPCVFPLLPLLVGGGALGNRKTPLYLAAGLVASFATLGGLAGLVGGASVINTDAVRLVAGALLGLAGLVLLVPALSILLAKLVQPLASKAQNTTEGLSLESPKGALLTGVLLGAIWTPCSGPLLLSILALAAKEGTVMTGVSYLTLFGVGAAIPLLAVAYSSQAALKQVKARLMTNVSKLKTLFGWILLLTGTAVVTGADKLLEGLATGLLPDAWLTLTTAI